MDSNKNLLLAFKTIKSEEDNTDCFSVAGIKRKTLNLDFFGSMHLNESIETTEFFVNEIFKEYAEVVDNRDSGKINNYADCVLSLLSNFQNDDRHKWKTHLDVDTVKKHIEPLTCSGDINCKNSEYHVNNFNDVKVAITQYNETKEITKRVSTKVSAPALPTPTSLPSHEINSRNVQSVNPKSEDTEGEARNKSTLFFRTARDELQIQNAKKFGKSNGNEKTSKGPIKRSLGTRKNGVFGKFQPPVRSDDTKGNEMKMEVDEVVDERLKNIDPAMIELIKSEIMDSGSKITWNDIAGLHLAKSTIQEIVVWPMLRPDIFTGLRRPPKGILLFGPPGTGKTLIGKCIASQSNSTFFSISASSLTSKWVGDGEKMVRTLFAVAKVYQPSVVFIDEIDSLLTQRSDSDHECSRRIKTEFLVQLDGAGTGDEDRILIIGATNRPQELDEAARRRLVKRLYIPLPDEEARKQIIQNLISTERHSLDESEIQKIAELTKGYSGADVKNLCQEASLGPIRSIGPAMIHSINPEDVRPLNAGDFESALCRIKSSVSESDLDIYLKWDKQYGCGSGTH